MEEPQFEYPPCPITLGRCSECGAVCRKTLGAHPTVADISGAEDRLRESLA